MTELSIHREPNLKAVPSTPAQPDQPDAPIGIVSIWRLLRSNKLTIVLPMIIFGVLAALSTLRGQDTFSTEAQLILTRDNIDIIELDSSDRDTIDFGVVTYAVNILNSRALALQVMERLDLANNPQVNPFIGLEVIEENPDFIRRALYAWGLLDAPESNVKPVEQTQQDYLLDWLQDSYLATALPNSNVVVVSVQSPDPQLSAEIANTAVETYLDFSLETSQQEANIAIDALSERVQNLRSQLQRDQGQLQDAQASMEIPSAEALQSLTFEISELRNREEDVTADLVSLQSRGAALNALEGQSAQGIVDAFATDDRLSGVAPQLTLANAGEVWAQARQAIANDLSTRERQAEAITSSRERLETRLRTGSENLSELSRLEVELETTRAVYSSALARLKELVLESGIRNKGGRFLAPAVPPVGADSQFRRRIVLIAMILGGLVGATIVLVREAANERVRDFSDIPGGLSRFACVEIPSLKTRFRSARARKNETFLKSGTTAFSEAVRNCRRLVMEQYDSSQPRVICVLSSLPNEGKSTLCGALARSFVLVDKRVLVIDADMRARGLTKSVMGMLPNLGLQQAIEGGAEVGKAYVTSVEGMGFDFLPAGVDEKNPADLLETDNFRSLITALQDDYDVVMIDTPPALLFPEARSVAALSSYSVMVAGFNQTPTSALREVLSILQGPALSRMTVALCKTPRTTGARFGVPERSLAY